MFAIILKSMVFVSFIFQMHSQATTKSTCFTTMIGCLCQDLERLTDSQLEPCCLKSSETLTITGLQVKNISVEIVNLKCANNFVNLIIRETALVKFYSPFKGLSNVSNIYIERNQNLSDFHKMVFVELNPNILNINVELNSFRSISKKTFANLTVLKTLKMSDNKIGFIEDHSFSGLRNLNLLYINNNILTLLTSDVFYGLESLTVLSLVNNPLQEPKSSDIFKYLSNLRYLAMSHGTSVELPGIGQLPPNVFFSVKQLKTLNMTSIRLKNLTALTFYGLQELEHLDLQGNRLALIPSGTLQQVRKIGSINLSRNQLYCLLDDTFQHLPKLVNLDLSHNELSYVSDYVFKTLTRLQTLDLSENNIYVIEKNAFVDLKSLMIIKINIIHGLAKNEVQTRFMLSPLAKLRNTTKIVGLSEYFGIFRGMNQPLELQQIFGNGSRKTLDRTKILCPVASSADKDWIDQFATGSRKYLLIIVGICVVFLLIAFAIIMTYRAWSKRRMNEMTLDVESEKQEMLQSKDSHAINGRLEKSDSNKSNHHSRKSINGGHEFPVKDQVVADSNALERHSNSQTVIAVNLPLSDDRSHSDDESALTPLGVL